jgi:hypothetical protein
LFEPVDESLIWFNALRARWREVGYAFSPSAKHCPLTIPPEFTWACVSLEEIGETVAVRMNVRYVFGSECLPPGTGLAIDFGFPQQFAASAFVLAKVGTVLHRFVTCE